MYAEVMHDLPAVPVDICCCKLRHCSRTGLTGGIPGPSHPPRTLCSPAVSSACSPHDMQRCLNSTRQLAWRSAMLSCSVCLSIGKHRTQSCPAVCDPEGSNPGPTGPAVTSTTCIVIWNQNILCFEVASQRSWAAPLQRLHTPAGM